MTLTITVIGTVFVDIKGHGTAKINSETKNVGMIDFANGGVGRNVAEAIGRTGLTTEFLSSVDYSGQGEAVVQDLRELGIRTDRVIKTEQGMGMWLAVLDGDGELVASISQKPNLASLEQLVFEQAEQIVKNSQAIVIEYDLQEKVLQKIFALAKEYRVPVYGIVGNLEVIMHRLSILDQTDLFICNSAEAEQILGRTIQSVEAAKQAARDLTRNGLSKAVITMGERGSVYYDTYTQKDGHVPSEKVVVTDTTGAGDCFFSGTVYGLASGFDMEHAVRCGTQFAAWTISSKENVSSQIGERVKNNPLFEREAVLS